MIKGTVVSGPSAVVMVSVVAVLGFLAWKFPAQALVAALGAIGSIVTWLTQGPTRPSTGQSLFPPPNTSVSIPPPAPTRGPLDP